MKLRRAKFFFLRQKLKTCFFYLLANPTETAYLSFQVRAFQRHMVRGSAAKKSGSSHLFGVVPRQASQTAFVTELSKAITFLSYVVSW